LNDLVARSLKGFFIRKQTDYKFKIISLAIESNHVHLLFQIPNSFFNINTLIKQLKGGSSLFIRKNFGHLSKYPSLWTPSHFLASSGNVSSETIKKYIEAQGIQETEVITRTFKYKVLNPTKFKKSILNKYFEECRTNKTDPDCPASIFQDFPRSSNTRKKSKQFGLYIRAQNSRIIKLTNTKLAKYWWKIPGGSGNKPIYLGLQGRDLPDDAIVRDSYLREVKEHSKKVLYAFLIINQERQITRPIDFKALSCDLGINHPVTSVLMDDYKIKETLFKSRKFKELLYRRKNRYKQLQKSKAVRKSSHNNKIKQELHNIINCLVDKAIKNKCPITIGYPFKLNKAFQKKNKKSNKSTRRKSVGFCYNAFIDKLRTKATLKNVPLLVVDEYFTSQRCPKCGTTSKTHRKGQRYTCKVCNYSNQADLIGGCNIYVKGLCLLSISYDAQNSSNEDFLRFSEAEEVQSSARYMNKQGLLNEDIDSLISHRDILERIKPMEEVKGMFQENRPMTSVMGS
jgi:putative transposase